jgi:hypothetical protein
VLNLLPVFPLPIHVLFIAQTRLLLFPAKVRFDRSLLLVKMNQHLQNFKQGEKFTR